MLRLAELRMELSTPFRLAAVCFFVSLAGAVLAQSGPARNTGAQASAAGDPAEGLNLLMAAESVMQQAIDRAGRSVVAIARVRRGSVDPIESFDFNLPRLDQPLVDPRDPEFIPTDFFSGVVVGSNGDILTCYHALGDPDQHDYWVYYQGQAERAETVSVAATVRAGDPWTDLAVLRVNARNLPEMAMGDAAALRRGSIVIALGNPYAIARDGVASASWGIVSNLQRKTVSAEPDATAGYEPAESLHEYGTLIQTDAHLNLGTSGGALVNIRGEMVGLTTSLAAVAGYETAAGYAIPIDGPMLAAVDALRQGREPSFGFLGIEQQELTPQLRNMGASGVLVRRVVPGLAADEAGIRAGDVIHAVDGATVNSINDLFRELSRRAAFSEIDISLVSVPARRAVDATRTVRVTLGKKYLPLSRPAYATNPEPSWRGMRVDHLSGLPPQQIFFRRMGAEPESSVAVTSVDIDSPAWDAGLRPGYLVLAVNGQSVQEPEEFRAAVQDAEGEVILRVLGDGRVRRDVTVVPSTPPTPKVDAE